MLLRAMCLHMVPLTHFYPQCAFETPNLEKYFHLSIFMLLKAMCAHVVLLMQFYLQYAFETPNLEIWKIIFI